MHESLQRLLTTIDQFGWAESLPAKLDATFNSLKEIYHSLDRSWTELDALKLRVSNLERGIDPSILRLDMIFGQRLSDAIRMEFKGINASTKLVHQLQDHYYVLDPLDPLVNGTKRLNLMFKDFADSAGDYKAGLNWRVCYNPEHDILFYYQEIERINDHS